MDRTTAMVQIIHQKMARHDDARSLLRGRYNTEVDILPDQPAKTLTIQLHPLANQSSDEAIRQTGLSARSCDCARIVIIAHEARPTESVSGHTRASVIS